VIEERRSSADVENQELDRIHHDNKQQQTGVNASDKDCTAKEFRISGTNNQPTGSPGVATELELEEAMSAHNTEIPGVDIDGEPTPTINRCELPVSMLPLNGASIPKQDLVPSAIELGITTKARDNKLQVQEWIDRQWCL